MKHPDWSKDSLTYGETMSPAMEAQTQEEADGYVDALAAWHFRRGHRPNMEEARALALANIGYWTGYCSDETAQRVMRLSKTRHPIFGTTPPTPEEAIRAGKELASKPK